MMGRKGYCDNIFNLIQHIGRYRVPPSHVPAADWECKHGTPLSHVPAAESGNASTTHPQVTCQQQRAGMQARCRPKSRTCSACVASFCPVGSALNGGAVTSTRPSSRNRWLHPSTPYRTIPYHTAISDQAHDLYILHGAYYMQDRDTRP